MCTVCLPELNRESESMHKLVFSGFSVQNDYIDTLPFTSKSGCGILSFIFASTMEVHNDVLQRS